MTNKIVNALTRIKDKGWRNAYNLALHRFSENKTEKRLGVSTLHEVSLAELNISDPDSIRYSPIPYKALFKALATTQKQDFSGTFIDYGCGKGRVVMAAATLPFENVIGLELAEALVVEALENSKKMKTPVCKNVDIICCDATSYELPKNTKVIHFYNPFRGKLLFKVMQNIATLAAEIDHEILVLFANPDEFERLLAENDALPSDWVTLADSFTWPHYESDDGLGNTYRIYKVAKRS